MRVTLKRADFYARAALKAATETKYVTTETVSIYASELADPSSDGAALSEVLATARLKLRQQHQLTLDLIAVNFAIRGQLAEANMRSGIAGYLTKNAQLAVEEARLRALLAATEPEERRSTAIVTSLDVALSKAKALREQPKDIYASDRDTIRLALLDATDIAAYRRQLKRFADERAVLNDALTAANVSNKIDLDAATIAVLQRADLLSAE